MKFAKLMQTAALAAMVASPALAAKTDMVLGVVLEPPILDPTAGAAAAIDEVTYANIFEGLTRIGPDGAVEPQLAKSWDISDDGLVYVFHLNEGVKFHDGADMDASDVKFSFERAVAEGSVNAQQGLFEPIESIEVVDPLTVKITLKRPTGNFLFNMAWGDAAIVDPASADSNATNPVGTGPFKYENWVKGDSVTIVKNPNYWGTPAKLDKATFKFIADPTASMAALLAGDIDGFSNYPSPETLPQFEHDPRYKVQIGTTEGETILAINNKRAPFNDIRVREAIAYAIDRQEIIDGAMFGVGTPIGSHFAPHNPAYVDLTGLRATDRDRARELLAQAGYPDGFDAKIYLPPPSYARRGGELIAAQLRNIGINLEIINVEWAQWLETVFKGKDFDLTIVSHTEPMDIGIYANPDYYFQYNNPQFQKLMEAIDASSDPAERKRMLGQAQRIIADDAVNGYLFQLGQIGIYKKGLMGMWENRPTQANDLTQVYWSE